MVRARALADPPRPARAPSDADTSGRAPLVDLAPLAMLGAVFVGVLVVRAGPGWIVGVALGGILLAIVLWVFSSVLWPGRADRACPACGAEAVVRADPDALIGRRCTACGWRDDAESAWMIAEEEEEALERLVLRQRRATHGQAGVDSPPAED